MAGLAVVKKCLAKIQQADTSYTKKRNDTLSLVWDLLGPEARNSLLDRAFELLQEQDMDHLHKSIHHLLLEKGFVPVDLSECGKDNVALKRKSSRKVIVRATRY